MNKYISGFIRVALLFTCFMYMFYGLNIDQLKTSLLDIGWYLFLPVLVIVLSGYLFLGGRLHSLILKQGGKASKILALKVSVITVGANSILPAKMGELVKIYLIHSKMELPVSCSVSIVFFERFADANILFLLLIFASFQVSIDFDIFLFIIVILWFSLILVLKYDQLFFKIIAFSPKFMKHVLQQLHASMNKVIFRKNIVVLFTYTLILWGLYFFQVWMVLVLIMQTGLSVEQALIVFIVSAIGMAIPSTPGSFGVYEASMILALSWYGVDKELAVMGALFCHFVQFVPTMIITLLILMKMPINFNVVRKILGK